MSVYRNLLDFYSAAFDILSKQGLKALLEMVMERTRIPAVVAEFVKHANSLQMLVNKAILEINQDIKNMLYDSESKQFLALVIYRY